MSQLVGRQSRNGFAVKTKLANSIQVRSAPSSHWVERMQSKNKVGRPRASRDIYNKFLIITINSWPIQRANIVTMDKTSTTTTTTTTTTSSTNNLFSVIFYFMFPVFILIYSIYRFNTHSSQPTSGSQRNATNNRSSDSIPDVKERMRLFNERKAALIARARDTYLKKHADATKLIE